MVKQQSHDIFTDTSSPPPYLKKGPAVEAELEPDMTFHLNHPKGHVNSNEIHLNSFDLEQLTLVLFLKSMF